MKKMKNSGKKKDETTKLDGHWQCVLKDVGEKRNWNFKLSFQLNETNEKKSNDCHHHLVAGNIIIIIIRMS